MPPLPALLPDVDDVALHMRTRTVGTSAQLGGLGSDTGPDLVTTFDDTTRPTALEVAGIIRTAYDSLIGSVTVAPEVIPEQQQGAFKLAVALYAVTLIEASFFRDQIDEDAVRDRQARIDRQLTAVNAAVEVEAGTRGFGTVTMTTGRSPVTAPTPADPVPGIDF
jgi:uncharacterized protein involved in response to NO